MKTNMHRFPVRLSVLVVQSALVSMTMVAVAQAEDATVESLTRPTSTAEVGVITVNPSNNDNRSGVVTNTNGNNTSYKFGEYNGLEKKGSVVNGNFDLRGGGAYDSDDVTRWRLTGSDLGLETRNIKGEYGQQGKFRLSVEFDELRRNRSDTYMTPYLGEGSNNFTLPSSWIKPVEPQNSAANNNTATNFRALDPNAGTGNALVSGKPVTPTAGTLATLASIRAADLAAFHNVNLHTQRSRTDIGFSYVIDNQWTFSASTKHEDKIGYKPLSVVSSQISEYAVTLADPIQQRTEQYNLGLGYKRDAVFFSADYYGSLFVNDIKSVTWNDVSGLSSTATIGSPPSNQFHQFSLTGGYSLSPTTKLSGFASYARNTQNESFVTAGQNGQFPLGLPVSSLSGLVVTKAVNLKLTAKPLSDLGVSAAYKYDDKDNQTPVHTYFFQDANESKSGVNAFLAGQGSNLNMYANRPYSRTLNQFNLDADYRLAKGHAIKAGYEFQQIDRRCDGSWINCADAPKSKEDALRAEWRGNYGEALSSKLSYAYSQRRVNYDENAFLSLVPYANVIPTLGAGVGATTSAYQYMLNNGLTGFGPNAGYANNTGQAGIFSPSNGVVPNGLYGSRNVISELIGMRRYNMADRNRDKLRASLNWQASEQLSLQAGVDYDNDKYNHSVYGLLSSKSTAFNLDGTFAATDNTAATLFFSYEDKTAVSASDTFGSSNNGTGANASSGNAANTNVSNTTTASCYTTVSAKNINAKTDPCLQWSTNMHDRADTLGLTLKSKGWMGGKLDVMGSLVFTRARTDINVLGGSYVGNVYASAGAQPGGVAFYYIGASALPTVVTDTTELALAGKYQIDKKSAVRVRYSYSHMKDVDWSYNGMQFGTGTNYMPTNEQAPNYTVQTLGVSYVYTFN